MLKTYTVEVELPTDTDDECCAVGHDPCRFLLDNYCTLFHETLASSQDHIYKLKVCPASGEKRYDD